MAYLRLGCIKQASGHSMSIGLKRAIEYIYNPEKTNGQKYIGGYNLLIGTEDCARRAYLAMMATKQTFGKEDGRQGYHFKLSFPANEQLTPELCMKITEEFCMEVLPDFECAYSVHTNTEHLHSHIVFNSIDLVEGYKYQYKNGEWAKYIQPAVNKLCRKYGLSELDLAMDKDFRMKHRCRSYSKWKKDQPAGKYKKPLIYSNKMILRDVEECIHLASSYDDFKDRMAALGHVIEDSHKYITVLAPGRERPARIINLTPDKSTYTKENIKKMIDGTYRKISRDEVKQRLLSDMELYYQSYKKLETSGLSMDAIKRKEMSRLIIEHNLTSPDLLLDYITYLDAADKELNIVRKRINTSLEARADVIYDMHEICDLYPAYEKYLIGDRSKRLEHDRVIKLYNNIVSRGYNLVELDKFEQISRATISLINDYKKHLFVEKKICKNIEAEYKKENCAVKSQNQKNREVLAYTKKT